ncbi:hypothetical protein DTL36_20660 [Bremerella cremea]|nr:hypothetical protein DTL36_20660 [Bremerella cremea]
MGIIGLVDISHLQHQLFEHVEIGAELLLPFGQPGVGSTFRGLGIEKPRNSGQASKENQPSQSKQRTSYRRTFRHRVLPRMRKADDHIVTT